jgi:hypothetical protein
VTDNFTPRLTRYVEGLTQPAHVQGPNEIDGDPQFAALCAYLSSHRDLTAADAIIDVGCGKGIVPRAMTLTEWATTPPTYVAIDLEEPLLALALAPQIHNNSMKVNYERFIGGEPVFVGVPTNLVILKNLLHELNISETAELLAALNSLAPANTEIYIQDMQQLPSAESRNAPWSRDRLIELLNLLEMNPYSNELRSKSGTPWFAIYCRTNKSARGVDIIGRHICNSRVKLADDLLEAIDELSEPDPKKFAETNLILSREHATIRVQIADWDKKNPRVSEDVIADRNVKDEVLLGSSPIVLKSADNQLTSHISEAKEDAEHFDVMAILRSKDAIRMAESISNATEKVWFFGYSNKHAFFDESNVSSIAEAVGRGVDIRILLVDPRSNAAHARSEHPAYSNTGDLEADILQALHRALNLQAQHQRWAPVRVTPTAPPCSYFIIDDYCVASFYTAHSTGTSGQSFVLRNTGIVGDFYSLLANEFVVAYDNALDGTTILNRDETV